MILTATTDKLSLFTDGSSIWLDIVATYIDRVISTGAVGAANRQLTTIASTATTDILSAPGADTARKLEYLVIRNEDATAVMDVTVQFNANGTLYELHGARLYPGDVLEYGLDSGFIRRGRRERVKAFRPSNAFDIPRNNSNVYANHANARNMSVKVLPDLVTTGARSFGMMFWGMSDGALTTTGADIGMSPGASIGQGSTTDCVAGIGVATNSATASTLMSISAGSSVDNVVAFGTSIATGGNGGFNVLGGSFLSSAGITREFDLDVVLSAEIAASAVTLQDGCGFEVFEATG